MALERPEAGWVWLHVPRREPVDVVVLGDICTWWAHFVRAAPGLKKVSAVRCGRSDAGADCAWCAAEVGHRARYVFPCRAGESVRLVELGRVQYSTLAMVYESGRWIGRRLRLRREWDAVNARIVVEVLGVEVVSPESVLDCSEYVAGLGASEARMIRPPEPLPPDRRSGGASAPEVAPRSPRWSERSQ